MSKVLMETPEGFKETEIGPLPEEWEVVRFDDCVPKHKISVGKVRRQDYRPLGKYPIIDQGQSFIAGYWDDDSATYQGDLPVIIFGDHTRIFKFIDFPFVCGADGTKILVPNRKIADPLFLFFALSRLDIPSRGYNRHFPLLRQKSITLPPLSEQRKIAKVLSTIQRAIEQQDSIIAAGGELKKSLMRCLFTYGPVPVAEAERVPLQDTEIGRMPTHWDVVPLKNVTRETETVDPRKDGTRKFTYIDVSAVSNRDYQITAPKQYAGSDAPSRARKLVKARDIIFATVRPYLKRITMIPQSLDGQICSTAFCVIRCKTNVADPIFVFNFLLTNAFVDRVSELQSGSSYPAVTDKQVLDQKIPLPPLPEQRHIATILSTVDTKIEAEQQRKELLQELFKTMLHKLMAGRIRVKDIEV